MRFALLTLATFIVGGLTSYPGDIATTPIDLHAGSAVEFTVKIARFRTYQLDLGIAFKDQQERKAVRQLIGGQTSICRQLNECGGISVFKTTVRLGQDILFHESRPAFGHYRFTDDGFFRNIAIVRLRPGTYSMKVDLVEIDSEFRDVRAAIVFNTDFRVKDLELQ